MLASLVLYLLPDPGATLRRWREILRPGGTVAFSWGIRPDPRWSPVFGAVDAYVKGADGFGSCVGRPGSPEEMTAMLDAHGYTGIRTSTHTVPVRYTGPGQWWQASWAEAPGLAWQHIPDADRDAARRAAFALLERMREPDGSLVRRVEMAYAVAHRPPEGATGEGPAAAGPAPQFPARTRRRAGEARQRAARPARPPGLAAGFTAPPARAARAAGPADGAETVTQMRRALGRQLAAMRNRAGLSQWDLAPRTGYSRSTLSDAELGRHRQRREFWLRCDGLLKADGRLVAAYDRTETAAAVISQRARSTAQLARDQHASARVQAVHPVAGGGTAGAGRG